MTTLPPQTRPDLRRLPAAPAVHVPTAGFDLRGETSSLRELAAGVVESRRLLGMLARKDFFVRYRRASFGLAWSVALPLFQAVVMALVFSHVVRINTGVSYPAFVYSGLLPWTYFAASLPPASTAIVDGQELATKIYFPRAILPLVTLGANLYGFLPALLILVGFVLAGHVHTGLNWLLMAPAIVVMVAVTASFSLVLSALHVYSRDVKYVVTAALTAWIYMSPVLYPMRLAHGLLRHLLEALPTTGVIELFRAASVGADPGWTVTLATTGVWSAGLLALAVGLHRRFDRVFVDLL